jgi:branched-chain amino acid transport system ATP-binding protein
MALSIAEHGYILETGSIAIDKPAAALRADDEVREFYLGLREEGTTTSFRDLKHYGRRKRCAA